MLETLLVSVLVVSIGQTGVSTPLDAQPLEAREVNRLVGLLSEVYSGKVSHEVAISEFADVEITDVQIADVPPEDRPEVILPEWVGRKLTKTNEWTHLTDGGDGLLVKRRVVTTQGVLSLAPVRMYSSTHTTNLDSGVPDELKLGPFAYEDADAIKARFKASMMTFDESRARQTESFLCIARWAGRMLLIADDCDGASVDSDTVRVGSKSLRMQAWLHPKSGELQRLEFPDPSGDTYIWWWEGMVDTVKLPARYPKWQYSATREPDGKVYPGSVRRTEKVVSKAIEAGTFEWWTYRPFAFNVKTGEVTDKHGVVDQRRSNDRKRVRPPLTKDVQVEKPREK